MRFNENRCGRARRRFVQALQVAIAKKPWPPYSRGRHAEHADAPQPINTRLRGIYAADRSPHSIEICIQKIAKFSKNLIPAHPVGRRVRRIRHHPIRHEMPGKVLSQNPNAWGTANEQFLSVNLFLIAASSSLFIQLKRRATTSCRACAHVQSHAKVRIDRISLALWAQGKAPTARRSVFLSRFFLDR